MKQSTKILFASLLAVSLTTSLAACGNKKKPHTHNYVFDSFEWTKLDTGYSAVARFVCAEDGDSIVHDAEVELTDTTPATCESQGTKTYTATYGEHTGTKVDYTAALGHSYVKTSFNDDSYVYECEHCHEKYYDVTRDGVTYYLRGKVTLEPTFDTTGTLVVSFYNFDESKQEFTHITTPSTGTFPYDLNIELPKFSDGSVYAGDTTAKTLNVNGNIYLTKAIRRVCNNAVGLNVALAMSRVINTGDLLTFAPEDFDTIYPNMIMTLDIRAGTTFTDGSMTTGTDTSLQTITALRKDNFHLPSNTSGFAYKHPTKDLVGYSNNINATTTNYSLGGFISASANKVIYCVWDDNHTFDDEHSEIITEATMESTGTARYYCQTAGHSDYEDRQIAKVKYTFIEDVFESAGNTVLTTTISQGTFKVGDVISICLDNKFKDVTIKTIEKYHESLQEVSAGDAVGIGIDSSELAASEVQPGLLITEPGKHLLSKKVEVYGHIYTQEEGGRHAAILNGYRPTFEINGRQVPGVLNFDTDIFGETLLPGTDNDRSATYTITFDYPVYLPFESTIYPKEGTGSSAKTTAEFTVDGRNELMAYVCDNYTAAGTENKLIYTDTYKLPTQYDYEYSCRLRGFDERGAVSGLENTQFAPGATIPANMRKVYMLNAIWGDAILTGAVTSARVVESRGTYVTVIVKGKAAQLNTTIMVKLADGSLKASVITGLLNSDGQTVDSIAVGQTAEILLRGIELNEISTSGVSFIWEKI